jgi:hypothetical protein
MGQCFLKEMNCKLTE